MDPDQEKARLLIENLPQGFIRLRMDSKKDGHPAELITLEVNRAFEKMTGQTREDLLGQPLSKIMPGIEESEFDWIGIFSEIAGGAQSLSFEQYFEPLDRWFDINVYSDKPGIINILFYDITAQKAEIASVEFLLELTKKLVAADQSTFDFRETVEEMKRLSGAKYVAINTYDQEHFKSVTRAIAGIPSGISHAAKILGFEPEGQAWEIIPERLRTIEGGKLVRFKSIYDTSMGAINKSTASILQKIFGFGDSYVIELAYGDRPALGDIIFFMPKNRQLKNREAIELYAAQLGSLLTRLDAEETARESREQYQSLVENIPGINYRCKWDRDWTMLYISPDVENITGYPAADFIENRTRSYESIIHREDSEKVYQQIKTAVKENKPWSIEYRVIHRNGSVRWAYEQGRGAPGSTGKVEYLDGFILDITERKKMENDLNETVSYVNSILESIPDIVLRCDREGTFLDLVSAPEEGKLFMPPDQFLGRKAEEILPAGVGSIFTESIQKTLATEQLTATSYELPVPEGNLYFNARFSRLTENEVIVLIEEVTRRKQAEDALNYRLEFEKMVSEISYKFVSLPPERFNEGIENALKQSAQFFGADCGHIFRFAENLELMSATHEWCAEGGSSWLNNNRELALDSLPWWANMLKNRDYLYIPDTSALPREAEAEKEIFKDRGIKSLLSIPIMRERQIFGCFCFTAIKEKKLWSDDQIALITVVTEVIANALLRNLNDQTIRYLSFHDQLTGLYNRHYFVSEIERLEGSREYPIAVISADLDGLKLVNDTMGHESGDSYLKTGAALLKESLRNADILARVGGDEFAILLPRTGYEAAEKVVARIYERAEYCKDEKTGLPLNVSLGMAVSETAEKNLEETYRDADALMYKDKQMRSGKAKNEMIRAMLTLLDESERASCVDNDYLQALSVQLGQAAGLSEKQLADLAMLSQVYEIGLIAVPESIRNKKGSLSEDELTYIYQYPEKGYSIALNSPEMSEIADLILCHRENYDGSGYPRGLKKEEIPLECRILAIVEKYLQLSGAAAQESGKSDNEALAAIEAQAGSTFDPNLVKKFSELMRNQIQ